MKVLFIGGTGVISEGVSRLAVEKGMELYLLNRGKRNELMPEDAKLITGDIRDPKGVADAIKGLFVQPLPSERIDTACKFILAVLQG